MASKTFIKHLKKHILKSTPVVSDYICATLWEFGEVTSRLFFYSKPSLTKPTKMLFGLDENSGDKKINKNTVRKNLERLVEQGIVKKKNKKFILSEEGKRLFECIGLRRKILGKKWDGRYRLVIFDIPEKKRADREWLREELYLLEYEQLQKSVFISKHPLAEDIIQEIQKRKMDSFVNYLLVDKVFEYPKLKHPSKKSKKTRNKKCDTSLRSQRCVTQ